MFSLTHYFRYRGEQAEEMFCERKSLSMQILRMTSEAKVAFLISAIAVTILILKNINLITRK